MRPLRLLPLFLLAACGPPPLEIAVPELAVAGPVAVGVDSVELLEVELPAYADGDTIYVQQGVAMRPAGKVVWADDPSRAVTLELARALGEATGVPVAPEPWPYEGDAHVRLDVRLAEFGADATRGLFVIRGLYYVAALDDRPGPNRAREVLATAPLPALDAATIAVARATAVNAMALQIAAEGLR